MVQPSTPFRDEASDGTLILLGGAGVPILDLTVVTWIELLQELQLAVTDSDEQYAQPTQRSWGAIMIDNTILVRGKAFHRNTDFNVRLAALHFTA